MDALKDMGVKNLDFNKRAEIAYVNVITGYRGTAGDNMKLLKLLKAGKLKKA